MDKEKISYFASGFMALGLVPLTAVIVPLYALGIGASPAEVGIIMAMRSLLPFLLAIPGGAMVDRYGVRFMVTRLALGCAVLSRLSVCDECVSSCSSAACFRCVPVILLDRCPDRYREDLPW